ncbi:MAG TPA: retroviral-like aspartic protease [Nostocaceae cyanobacterium]|nr:retroviral-like aspartic protease [Nostocaceae cyanobacterium]
MFEAQRFPYLQRYNRAGIADFVPHLPFTLTNRELNLDVIGLLDTGSSVNVLPYSIGLHLGKIWEEQTTIMELGGNLSRIETRGVILSARICNFPSVKLAFAWAKTNNVPLILGQMNFFHEFDVCFYRSQLAFDIRPKSVIEN